MQAIHPDPFILAVGTIDRKYLYQFLDLDLGGDHEVSGKQKLLASFSHTFGRWGEVGGSVHGKMVGGGEV